MLGEKEGKTESEGGSQGSYEEGFGQGGLKEGSWSCVGFDSGCDGIPSAAVWRVALAGDPFREQQVAWGTLRPAGLHATAALQQHHLDDLGQGWQFLMGRCPGQGRLLQGLEAQSQV